LPSPARAARARSHLPTIAEFYQATGSTVWLGLFAPAGTGTGRASAGRGSTRLPDVKAKLNQAGGLDAFTSMPEEFAALIQRDYDKYGKIVKEVGVKVD
jgi:tripartite-type tricarboxylate transporter receptor subunit TctC